MGGNDKIKQNLLPVNPLKTNKLHYCSIFNDQEEYRILDVGFGTGTNTLLAIKTIQEKFSGKKIVIHGVEQDKYLLDYLNKINKLKIHEEQEKILNSISSHRTYEGENLKIRVFDGEIQKIISELPNSYNFVMYDLFSDSKLPWNTEFFNKMKRKLSPGAIFATHKNTTDLRLNLSRAGFDVFNGPEVFKGITGTHAILDPKRL